MTQLFDFETENGPILVNNRDWLSQISLIEFYVILVSMWV